MPQKTAWICKLCNKEVRNKTEWINHISNIHSVELGEKVKK